MRRVKVIVAGIMVCIGVLLGAPMAARAQVQVPVVIDPAKLTVQVPVSQTIKGADGVYYQVSGTLTVKPVPPPTNTGDVPPAPAPSSALPQVFSSDWDGSRMLLVGEGFGEQPGRLLINFWEAPPASWGPARITAESVQQPSSYTIVRPDGEWWTAKLGPSTAKELAGGS